MLVVQLRLLDVDTVEESYMETSTIDNKRNHDSTKNDVWSQYHLNIYIHVEIPISKTKKKLDSNPLALVFYDDLLIVAEISCWWPDS
jgi:hypothetical protein